jgi:DNA-directed RNA polymerase subunit RPC12/RpoP
MANDPAMMPRTMSETTHLKMACERCGGHIEYPSEMAGQSIQCPHCQHTITLPSPPPPIPPQPTPQPPPVPGSARPSPRHGIFYYVFWGTVSLFGTLAILFFGFIFLTAVGAGFLSGLSHRSATVKNTTTTAATQNLPALTEAATQNLPALTETEIEQARSLVTALNSRTDAIEGTTWYSPNPADNYETAVYLYIGQKQTGHPFLRWKIRYHGEDWLFIRRYRLKIDNAEAVTVLPTREIKRENSGGEVWETFDELASAHADVLNQILAGNTTYLRMEGSEGSKDIELGPEQLQRMRDVLLVFRYLGGTWPAN